MTSPDDGAPRPLRIVDFSTHLSGPLASYLLRDLGAEVIKIENPRTGDGNRFFPPMISGTGKFHVGLNAGARSIAVDVRSPHWAELVAAATRWADAVIVGSRPADARRRGIDFASLSAIAPDLVYCAISAYGEQGPWSGFAAHGQNADAMAGNLPIEWIGDRPTTPPGWRSAGSTLAGVFAALGIMGALYQRDGGDRRRPRYVTVSLWQSALWWNWRDLNLLANNGNPTEYQDFGSRYAMYPTADRRAILVCPIEEKFWQRFCEVVGLPEEWSTRGAWATAHVDHGYDDEREPIATAMRSKPLEAWMDAFQVADIPFAAVLTLEEAMTSQHARQAHVMRSFALGDDVATAVAAPYRILDSPEQEGAPRPFSAPPSIGAHTRGVLEDLGLGHLADDWSSDVTR